MTSALSLIERLLPELANLAETLAVPEAAWAARRLAAKILAREWLVLMLGETSSGKSTWLNTLLGDDLLPATPGATTGTVVELRFVDGASESFSGIDAHGNVLPLPRQAFQAACLESERWTRLQVNWPIWRVPSAVIRCPGLLEGLVLVDAPGYNSCVSEHREILTEVLPEADAVIAMLNFRRGYTPEDKEFQSELLRHGAVAPASLFCAVNWMPAQGGERQLANMRRFAAGVLGQDLPIYPLYCEPIAPGQPRIWSDELWSALMAVATSPERASVLAQNAHVLTESLIAQLRRLILDRATVMNANDDQLDDIRDRIAEIRALGNSANVAVEKARAEMVDVVNHSCERTRDELWTAVESAIDEANRLIDANSCGAYVKSHLAPHHVREGAHRLEKTLWEHTDWLGDDLERLHAELEEVELPTLSVKDPQFQALRELAAQKGLKKMTEQAFMGYLSKMGGAAGSKAGFVNLAKKTVSQAGKVFGKKFSREFYNQMGARLRQIGLSAGLATAVVAAVVVEVAAYLYNVWRWKDKLKGGMQRALGLPPVNEPLEDAILRVLERQKRPALEIMAEDTKANLNDALDKTLEMVERNFERRADVLAEALELRRQAAGIDPAPLEAAAARLKDLHTQLIHHQRSATHEEPV